MPKARVRAAVAPLRRPEVPPTPRISRVDTVLADLRPDEPMVCLRPATMTATARRFVSGFPGNVLYAVKCNPEPTVLRALWQGGVRHFDCASPGEIRLIRQMFPDAAIHYMHPVKAPSAIRQAYASYGVRDFSLDTEAELDKILLATEGAADLGLMVRLAPPKADSLYDLSGKFGATAADAAAILRRARGVAARIGVCFHVGSQCMEPEAYARAVALVGEVVAKAGVEIDVIDVGGGFPVSYPDITPPDLDLFFEAITRSVVALGLPVVPELWCEPGRALVAAGASVVVRVEDRRGDVLYINDGIYGSLSDAGVPKWRFPARLVRDGVRVASGVKPFSFYGPSCDSADYMRGPFFLPDDVRTGDWIELGQLGAYGACLRTGFNGFDRTLLIEVSDAPLLATPGHSMAVPPRRVAA